MKFQAPYIRPLSLARGYRTIYGQVPIRNNHTHKNVFYTVDLQIDMSISDIRFLPFSNIRGNGIEPLFLGYEPSVTTLPPTPYKMRSYSNSSHDVDLLHFLPHLLGLHLAMSMDTYELVNLIRYGDHRLDV